jgi:hypothetical protein
MYKWLTTRRSRSLVGAAAFTILGLLMSGGVPSASAHGRPWQDQSGPSQYGRGWGSHGGSGSGQFTNHGGSGSGQFAKHGGSGSGQFTNTVFVNGSTIMHPGPIGQAPEAISNPDDITYVDGRIFVGFQNGVGPQGQASATGNTASTIVEFNLHGDVVNQWDIVGKCDGVTADPITHRLIATVNEDANSSLYVIDPHAGGSVVHYSYNEPLPSDGGTDAISIYRGMILISASAPGTTGAAAPQPTYPAVYRVTLDHFMRIAYVQPLFYDEASATVANLGTAQSGTTVSLALTDPDSNEDVPFYAARFAGDFMLTSQGDMEQIFVRHAGTPRQSLSVLKLSDSVDDTVWPSDRNGAIFTTDNSNNTVNEITGPFRRGEVFVADTPCDANDAPSTCPGPGFPPNFLGQLNPYTGTITPVTVQGPAFEPQGMLFLP